MNLFVQQVNECQLDNVAARLLVNGAIVMGGLRIGEHRSQMCQTKPELNIEKERIYA